MQDGKVDLDLIQPAGVDWTVNGYQFGILFAQPSDTAGTTMRRTVVQYPKDPSGLVIGRLGHDLCHEPVKGRDPTLSFTPTKQLGSVDIECRQIGPCPTALILVFYLHGRSGLRRECGTDASPGLDTGLLISRQNEFVLLETPSFPDPFIEIENSTGFCGEVWIARKDPAAVLPRTDGIFIQPTPDGAVTDGGHQAGSTRFPCHIRDTPSGKREMVRLGQLTGQSLYLNDDLWGEKPGGDPGEGVPRAPAGVPGRIAFATC